VTGHGYTCIDLEMNGDVAVIAMDDPATLNAASLAMVDQLLAAFESASRSARAIVLTGRGRGFCTGANLGGTLDPEVPGYDAGLFLETHYNRLMQGIRSLSIPIVTAVNGPAAGIGATLGLAGDLIVAGRSAFFLQAFSRIGLVPDGGSAFLLIRAAGRPRAMEMLLLGERIDAEQAHLWGLVNRVVDDAQLLVEAIALAKRLARGPTVALGMTRRLAWTAMERSLDEMLSQEREMQRTAGRTEDHREGVAAFLEKRAAQFVGR
jgi:2-(1,2-epoxy-1,2-dihydrophenyl)acetyl-CoA isomerase